ncbi:MAG: response regulator transcription factor [Pseudomonadales bacterium]|nr:response regulator transcription factor [Pseudomonadales bacterium]MCP5356793.1 response regulator transcription factor [Pseudomonadales bacterium]
MKVLVIEDNRDIAANIADYLEPKGHILDFAANGLQGLQLAVSERYDVIVLDIMLPGLDGFSLCHRLRTEARIGTPVLMLTARDQLDDKLEGFRAGADDYLVKPFSVKELEVRMEALVKRSQHQGPSRLLKVADLEYDPDSLVATRAGQMLELNPIQRKLLEALMLNTHRVVTREELESLIWGDEVPDTDVLRTHIYHLRNVVDKPFAEKLIQTVHGAGYRLQPH